VCDVRTRAVCRSLLNGVLTLLHIDSQRAIFVESLSRRLHVPLVTSSAPPPQPISGHQAVISSTVLYIQPRYWLQPSLTSSCSMAGAGSSICTIVAKVRHSWFICSWRTSHLTRIGCSLPALFLYLTAGDELL